MTINYRESTPGDTTNQPTAGEIPLERVNFKPLIPGNDTDSEHLSHGSSSSSFLEDGLTRSSFHPIWEEETTNMGPSFEFNCQNVVNLSSKSLSSDCLQGLKKVCRLSKVF